MSKRIHFMGIGGAGVSAVAAFAKDAGFEISGCDLDLNSQFVLPLKGDKVSLMSGHDKSHLEGIDQLVVSPAIESLDPDNQELKSAKRKNIPVQIGEKFLAKNILQGKKVIAITGTHGKSTTTAMVGKILEEANLDPNVFIGAVVLDWGKNYRLGKGDYFVIEADEYQEKFLLYSPIVSVVTAIEMDHPEYFENQEAVRTAFQKFVDRTATTGTVVLGQNVELQTSAAQIEHVQSQNFELKLIGRLNQENASVAATVAKAVGVPDETISRALQNFSGISRRFEFKGEEKGVKVFDDYGHHPTAIKATINAAREKFEDSRIWLVYQPHMFTRTKYLAKEFVEIFRVLSIKEIILVDIFAARQENKENISSRDIVDQVDKENVRYLGNFAKTIEYLLQNLGRGDVVVVMGAGDVYKLSEGLLVGLKNKSNE